MTGTGIRVRHRGHDALRRTDTPRLSFWFDRAKPNPWLAHRIPLYGDGPEVLVIRDGIPPRWLSDE
jgi:hypothetical protein